MIGFLGKRNSSSLKMSSEPEFVCFRIDENDDIIQVDHATHLTSSRKIEVSTTSKALSDVTAIYQNGTGNGELENKENSMCPDVINRHQKAAEALSNMSEKSKSICKSRERSGNYKSTKEGCKSSSILSNISSFVPHIRQKQQGALPLFGKKDIKIKALEVAEAAKRLEEKKQIAREMKTAAAAVAKLERKKLVQENAKQLELKQKIKEEERKKKEADVAARKRHREEEERKAKERKRRCIEETRTLQREHEDKLRQEKGKDFQEKATKQKGRKQVTNFKGQQKLEKEHNPNGNQIAPRVLHCTIQSASCTTESADYIIQDLEASNDNTYIAKDSQPYEMSPYQNSDDEEIEDDAWRKKKYIPLWARRENLGPVVLSTRHIDPKQIFCRKRSFNIPEGFAFVYFEDERDAEDAIGSLDNAPFGYSKRRLSVEWSRGDRGGYQDSSRGTENTRPTKTLFVINFDPIRTRTRDFERHFEPYGKVTNVRIRRNFAFVQFDSQEEVTKALECTNMRFLLSFFVPYEFV